MSHTFISPGVEPRGFNMYHEVKYFDSSNALQTIYVEYWQGRVDNAAEYFGVPKDVWNDFTPTGLRIVSGENPTLIDGATLSPSRIYSVQDRIDYKDFDAPTSSDTVHVWE